MERIVVGIDGSEGAATALAWAVEEAARRGATVEAVHAWSVPFVEPYPYAASAFEPEVFEAAARTVLDEAVAGVDNDAGVPIEKVPRCGTPALVLIDAAKGAELLVVGSRGRGGFSGLLLGSVSQQVSHHASCPVVIVPDHR